MRRDEQHVFFFCTRQIDKAELSEATGEISEGGIGETSPGLPDWLNIITDLHFGSPIAALFGIATPTFPYPMCAVQWPLAILEALQVRFVRWS